MSTLSLDFETASELDLPRVGVHVYAAHPSTRVLCMAWAFDDEPVQVWRPGQPFPDRVIEHVRNNGKVSGWNVGFEFVIWNQVLDRSPRLSTPGMLVGQLEDTMARAAYWGLPLSLDAAGAALKTKTRKDKAGHALMMRMCRPRSPGVWWHETDPAKYDQLCDYCAIDVEVEREIARALPSLPEIEVKAWRLDRRMNNVGVAVDKELVGRLTDLVALEKTRLDAEMADATGGEVMSTTKVKGLTEWLARQGLVTDLRRDTLKNLIRTLPAGPVRRALSIRAEAAKASTAKLRVLREATGADGRMRGMLQYYGANRTGRWAGRLFQPQNLPRPSIKPVAKAVDTILAGADAEAIDLLFADKPMGVIASCLRSTLVAAPNHLLFAADLSQIEARVIAWLAGQEDVLDVFRRGEDIYVYAANKVGSNDRQYGKVQVLALGFGMGPPKFQTTAATYGIKLSAREAEDGVRAWRENNPNIVQFWWDCGDAAMEIAKGEARVDVGRVCFQRVKKHMLIRLPSGRHLVYRNIRVEEDNGRPSVVYDGVNQYTKKWGACRTYGGKIVENITQAVARDVMRDAMLNFDELAKQQDLGRLILSVHDEVIGEVGYARADAALQTMLNVMRETPLWAPGLPVNAEGWVGPRYRK